MKAIRIIVSGGGTGGHIFPALAIASLLKEEVKGAAILFVGAKGKMEMEKVQKQGFELKDFGFLVFKDHYPFKM